jgi:DNA polymerase/3'-5' exonuclease PolX
VAKDPAQSSQTSLPGVMDKVDVRFTRARAIHAASRLKPILLKYVLRGRDGKPLCRLAGSLRRRSREVHDIDVVACVSRTPDDLMAPESNPRARLRSEITARGGKIVSWGPDHAHFTFEDIPVDLYFAKPSRFAVALLIATGSARHLRKLDLRARARNLHLQPAQHLLATNDYAEIALDSESDVYQALGVPYQSPQQRE